jgi:predicted nucleotidyltransferase
MTEPGSIAAPELPAAVERALAAFTESVRQTFGDRLVSVTLFGSAAEGRLRATSDVNVAVVARSFTRDDAVRLREPLTVAHAAIELRAMLLREDEVAAAAEAFAAKFADIRRRRFVLAGADAFAGVVVPRGAEILRVKQVLLNLVLRTRLAYAQTVREPDHERVIADLAGPLRACAAALLELEGTPATDARDALERVATAAGPPFRAAVDSMVAVRRGGDLEADAGARTLFTLLDLAEAMRSRAGALREGA